MKEVGSEGRSATNDREPLNTTLQGWGQLP
jgi:hypothetical protein